MRQVGRDSKGELVAGDDVFDKWMQALASAADAVTEGRILLSRAPMRFISILPVLVVSDNTLWVADYSSNGRIERDPFQVDEVTFYLGRKYEVADIRGHIGKVNFTISHREICTRRSVDALLSGVASPAGGIWQELFDQ